MIYLPDHNALFIHIPRTGGTWLEETLNVAGIRMESVGLKHGHLCCGGRPFDLVRKNGAFTFTFLRHPVRWYISHWAFRTPGVSTDDWDLFERNAIWHPTWDIDADCMCGRFVDFVEACIDTYPGYLSNLFHLYTKVPPTDVVNFIGRTENLRKDFLEVMDEIGVPIDEDVVWEAPEANRASPNAKEHTKFNLSQLNRLMSSEKQAMKKFGFSWDPADMIDVLKPEAIEILTGQSDSPHG